MKRFLSILLDGLRAALLRSPRGRTITAGPGPFLALVVVYFAVTLGIALFDTPPPWQLESAGVVALLADCLLTLIGAWVLAVLAQREEIVWGVAAIVLAAATATDVMIHWPAHTASALLQHDHALLSVALELIASMWWLFVLLAFAHWLAPRGVARALLAAGLAYGVSTASWWWLPTAPLVVTSTGSKEGTAHSNADDALVQANLANSNSETEDDATAQQPDFDAEAVMYQQPALLDDALARLKPQTPGKVDLYVVAFAGDGGENVFRNEVEYAEQLFAQRFDADGHVLVLENNAASVSTRPLATWTNLHRSLDAIARKIDPAEDIVLVYLTTHGSEDHQLLVDLDPLPLDQIEPVDLADAFKTTPPLRWKVIIVNACYSGGFVDALRDDSTMVMTSARADRTSFGCGAESDITYFGRAFLVDALNKTTSLRDAFDLAKQSVRAWETADHGDHSEPQIATSPGIEAQLSAWQRQLPTARPAVPFAPSPANAGD